MGSANEERKGPTTILDLPSELIALFVSYLSDADVFATRQTARYLERSSFTHFGKRFFRKKGYMLTSNSLAVLQGIAANNDLKKHVQHIWFNPDCFTFFQPEWVHDPPGVREPDDLPEPLSPRNQERATAYYACMDDHRALLTSSAAKLQAILTDVFSKLPNLETIGMRRGEDHQPCGWARLRDAVGKDPRVLGLKPFVRMPGLSGSTKLFIAIVHAVASSRVRLRRLYTDAIEIDNVRPGLLKQDILEKACGSLWYLEMNATRASSYTKRDDADLIYLPSKSEKFSNGLVGLLKATSSLKEIGLQLFRHPKQQYMVAPDYRDPESWRRSYTYVCMEKIVHTVQLNQLERVKLEKVTTSPDILLAFLSPARFTLRSLKIRDIRLLEKKRYDQPWKPIFAFLATSCPNLAYILLYRLMHTHGGISFVEEPPMSLPPSETDPTTETPNTPFGEPADGETFMVYDHIALEVGGRSAVKNKVEELVEGHWYHKPIFSYALDEQVWHTDTSDEEW